MGRKRIHPIITNKEHDTMNQIMEADRVERGLKRPENKMTLFKIKEGQFNILNELFKMLQISIIAGWAIWFLLLLFNVDVNIRFFLLVITCGILFAELFILILQGKIIKHIKSFKE